jgi:CheY-like chemotaxis protein
MSDPPFSKKTSERRRCSGILAAQGPRSIQRTTRHDQAKLRHAVKKSTLSAEDEWLVAEDYSSTLRAAGYAIVGPTPSVEGALALIADTEVRVALLDINLSGETSYPVAERLAECNVPFAFMTGYATRDLPTSLSGRLVVSKPISEAALLATVGQLLAVAK